MAPAAARQQRSFTSAATHCLAHLQARGSAPLPCAAGVLRGAALGVLPGYVLVLTAHGLTLANVSSPAAPGTMRTAPHVLLHETLASLAGPLGLAGVLGAGPPVLATDGVDLVALGLGGGSVAVYEARRLPHRPRPPPSRAMQWVQVRGECEGDGEGTVLAAQQQLGGGTTEHRNRPPAPNATYRAAAPPCAPMVRALQVLQPFALITVAAAVALRARRRRECADGGTDDKMAEFERLLRDGGAARGERAGRPAGWQCREPAGSPLRRLPA